MVMESPRGAQGQALRAQVIINRELLGGLRRVVDELVRPRSQGEQRRERRVVGCRDGDLASMGRPLAVLVCTTSAVIIP